MPDVRSPAGEKIVAWGSLSVSSARSLTTTIARLNIFFATFGLVALAFNWTGLHNLPDSFIQEYARYAPKLVHVTALASLVLLVPLGVGGLLLLRRRPEGVLVCEIVFLAEIFYFPFFWYRWPLAVSPLNLGVVAAGYFNAGLFLQVVTAYPLVGLICLQIARVALKQTAQTA